MNERRKPVRVAVEYVDGDGEDVRIFADLAGVPRRADFVVLPRPGVRLRVVEVEWRPARGNSAPEVVVFGELSGAARASAPKAIARRREIVREG